MAARLADSALALRSYTRRTRHPQGGRIPSHTSSSSRAAGCRRPLAWRTAESLGRAARWQAAAIPHHHHGWQLLRIDAPCVQLLEQLEHRLAPLLAMSEPRASDSELGGTRARADVLVAEVELANLDQASASKRRARNPFNLLEHASRRNALRQATHVPQLLKAQAQVLK